MNNRQLKIGSLLSYVQMAVSVLIGLFYTPAMTHLLGQSEYGLYNTVASTISMLTILNLGFNSSYIRYYAKYKKENNTEAIYKLNGMFLTIFAVIGIIAFVCGIFISFNLDIVFSTGLTVKEYRLARILMILLTFNLAVSFPMSVFSNIISANERFIFLKLLGMLKSVFGPMITLPLLLMGFRSVAMVTVTVLVSIITDTVYMLYVLMVLKNKFVFHGYDKGLFGNLFVYTSFIAINLIVDQINWNIDKILLGRYKGTVSVAVYSVGYSLYQYYQTFSTSVSSVFTPRIHRIINITNDNPTEQKRQLTEIFTKVGRIQFLVLGLAASGLVFFGYDFITKFWVGKGYEESYYVMLLLVLPASIALIQNLGIEIQRGENKHQFRSIAYFFMAIVNFILSVFLCQMFGAVGSALGTAVSLVFANGLLMNVYYHKRCNIDILAFWKSILSMSKGMAVPIIAGIIINKFARVNSPFAFVALIAVYTFIYCISMWFMGMNKYEKDLAAAPIMKFLRHS